MECTQRLECTQDDIVNEKPVLEQIGFLGICGLKHPITKGPNKVGRDPKTCSIVLDDNSISRHHAVINVLTKDVVMLMDLDSSNKTKLLGKTLEPYIPLPLKNGDTVQFGQLFGIFRLFEEDDDDLPTTQAVEVPETPVYTRNMSRLKTAPITTVPESPEVSDRDDSIMGQSPKKKPNYKSPNNNFIQSSRKIIETQGIGTNKINNIYWTSSKKSDSFSSNFESNSSYTINRNSNSPKKLTLESSIYDMETQVPGLPSIDKRSHSIYEADTQVLRRKEPLTIYDCETQVTNVDKLPEVYKVSDQSNVRLNLYSTNEKFNIFEAETQVNTNKTQSSYTSSLQNKEKSLAPTLSSVTVTEKNVDAVSDIQKKLNSSDEEICFDEVDCQQNDDECGSQPLLPPDMDDIVIPITNKENREVQENGTHINAVLKEPETKDSEEIAPSQVVLDKPIEDEDLTDCEDNMIELVVKVANQRNKDDSDETDCEDQLNTINVGGNQKTSTCDDDLTDCEDDVIEISQNTLNVSSIVPGFDDLPTQIITEENIDAEKKYESVKDDVPFEEMLTQVIDECPIESNDIVHEGTNTNKPIPFEDLQTEVIDLEIPKGHSSSATKQLINNNNFKRPLSSPKLRKNYVTSLKPSKSTKLTDKANLQSHDMDDQNYYAATQEILHDLCTQSEQINNTPGLKIGKCTLNKQEEQETKVMGEEESVEPLSKKKSSDSSDLEITPKKCNLSKLLMIDLPNSQDIKSCHFITSKVDGKDSSDESEDEDNKLRRKKDVKLDLMKKFDINTLPKRAITRIRKPTSKILDSDSNSKKMTERILQSNLGLDRKQEIDREIVELNLKRLRNKMEKANNKTSSKSRISDKHEKGAPSKIDQKEESLKSSDKKESTQNIQPQKSEKVLRQQYIKSLFNKPTSKGVTPIEGNRNVKTESTDYSKESRRSSRNRSNTDKKAVTETNVKEISVESKERKKSSSRSNISRKQVKETIDLTVDQETVVRRSRRHQSSKDKSENKKEKSQRKKASDKSEKSSTVTVANNELSAVYNLSSETAVDSPTNLKRQASGDIFSSKSKRAKSSNTGNASIRSASLRGIKTQYVLFTAFPCEEVKLKLEKLGAEIVSDVKKCTVVLTLQIKRTFKLLCAMGLGKPIVGPNWVQACADSNMIVDPWLYLIKDEATEKRFGFNLRQSLTCKRNFLKGCNVYCTPSVTPCAQEMKCIVECSGGSWKQGGRNWYCVTCQADSALWPELRKRGAIIVSTEFVLGGVLQQRMNLERDRLP